MNKRLLGVTLLCVFSVSACRSPKPVQQPKMMVRKATLPEVGATAKAGVGENLLISGLARTTEILIIPTEQTIGEAVIRAGKYPKMAHGSEYRSFRVPLANKDNAKSARQGNLYLFEKDVGTRVMCVSRTSCAEVDYRTEEQTDFQRAISQQTLIYSGRIGNRITLGYREFNSDMARPAFNNDVTYDLSDSKILGYKGARIEVLNASNTEITYKVLSDFN